jgi:hypothetical protein
MSGTAGPPQLSFDMVTFFNAGQRPGVQFPNAIFTPHMPGTTVFVGLRGRI